MAKTATGHRHLQEVFDTINGADAESIIEVYKDTLNQPANKPATSIGSLSVGWLSTEPSSVADNLWASYGTPTIDGSYDGGVLGGSITGSLDGGLSNYASQTDVAEGNHYSWSPVGLRTGKRRDGTPGTNGLDGYRGAGRFFKNIIMSQWQPVPAVGSAEFNSDASQAICEARGGVFNLSCNLTSGLPRHGDTVVVNYYDYTSTTISSRTGVHDGTGTADNDWNPISLTIDGSLLVEKTVVADSLVVGYVVTEDLKGGSKVGATENSGDAGYYFDSGGDVSIGDGTNDLTYVNNVLKVPSNALSTVTAPSDTAIHFEQSDTSKYTLQVVGGKGFVAVGEDIDLTGHVNNTVTGYSTATIPKSELEDDAVYVVTADNPDSIGLANNDLIKDLRFILYINEGFSPKTFSEIHSTDGDIGYDNDYEGGYVTYPINCAYLRCEAVGSNYVFELEMNGPAAHNTGGALRTHPITGIKRIQ